MAKRNRQDEAAGSPSDAAGGILGGGDETDASAASSPSNRATNSTLSYAAQLDARWTQRFEELRHFQSVHGHCRPSRLGSLKSLGDWANDQRRMTKGGKMREDRLERLRSIGFDFWKDESLEEARSERWSGRLEELRAYKARHGHCKVPRAEDEGLRNWVKDQRRYYRMRFTESKRSPMTDERVRALEEIGFLWETATTDGEGREAKIQWKKWRDRLEQLRTFQQRHGHCNVPERTDKSLQKWVYQQRIDYRLRFRENKASPMTDERVRALEEMGFEWEVKRGPKPNEAAAAEAAAKAARKASEKRAKAKAAAEAARRKASEKRTNANKNKKDKKKKSRLDVDGDTHASLLEEQEKLFREAAARVRLQQQQQQQQQQHQQHLRSACSATGPQQMFSEPVEDLTQLQDDHWKWADWHARLGLPRSSSLEEIKRQYRKLSLLYHPDKSRREDALERFCAVKEAYEHLVNKSIV